MLKNAINYYFEPFKTSLKIAVEAIKFITNIPCLVLENAGKISFNLLITSSTTTLGLAFYNSMEKINKAIYKLIGDICYTISSEKESEGFFGSIYTGAIDFTNGAINSANLLLNKISGREDSEKKAKELAELLNMKNNNEYLKYALCIVFVSTILITLYNSKSEESLAIKNNIKENVNNFFSLSYKLFADLFSNTDEKIDNILVKSTNELNENFDNIVKNNLDDVENNSSNLCENLSDNVIIDDVLTNCDSNIEEIYDIDNIGDVPLD